MKKKALCLLLASAMVLGLAACGNDDTPPSGSSETGTEESGETDGSEADDNSGEAAADTYTLNYATTACPTNWNPHIHQTATDSDYMLKYLSEAFYVFDYNEDKTGYALVPGMATAEPTDVTAQYVGQYGIEEGDTAKAWSIPLREDLCWEDGAPIKAQDFVRSAELLLNPVAMNYRADSFYNGSSEIVNAKNYIYQGQTAYATDVIGNGYIELADFEKNGWSGSALDPYGLMEAYTTSTYQYDPSWDTSAEMLTINLGGDWGISETLYRGLDAWDVFISKLPATLLVNVYSVLFSVPLGLALGVYAALKKNKWQDYLISTAVMVFISVPSYVYALLVQYLLCFKVRLFPLQMNSGSDWFTWSMFLSVVPAVLYLSFGSIAGLARYTRAELAEVLTSDFMLLARIKGLTRGQATVRHALRNSMVPIFPMILGEFIGILGGSFVIEKIFGVPGVGQLMINSITGRDYNIFMLLTAFYTLISLMTGLVVDLSYGFIDPRIRMGAR